MPIKNKLIFTGLLVLLAGSRLQAQVLGAARKDDGIESIYPDYSRTFVQKLLDTAEKNYPQVKIRAEQVKIANTTLGQAKAAWWEGISITPSYVYNPSNSINLFNSTGASTNFFNGYQIAFTISLSSFITRPYVVRNARQAIEVAKYEEDMAKITLKTQVKHYYVLYLDAQAKLRLAIRATNDAQAFLAQVKHDFQAGLATANLTVYNSTLTAFNAQNVSKITAESAVLDAKNSLEELVGKRLEDIK